MSQFKHAGNKFLAIQRVCQAIGDGDLNEARAVLHADYPFVPGIKGHYKRARPIKPVQKVAPANKKRPRTVLPELEVCIRDCFIDRYTGHNW